MDPKETIDEQEKMIMKNKEEGRVAEITTDLFLQTRTKMLGNKGNGSEDFHRK